MQQWLQNKVAGLLGVCTHGNLDVEREGEESCVGVYTRGKGLLQT